MSNSIELIMQAQSQNEKLARKGKQLAELSPQEFAEYIHEASGK